jgi:hypothetical protein
MFSIIYSEWLYSLAGEIELSLESKRLERYQFRHSETPAGLKPTPRVLQMNDNLNDMLETLKCTLTMMH